MRQVVDTNVLIAANGRSTHASAILSPDSGRFLAELISGTDVLLEDSTGQVFDEYKRYLEFSGQPGVGDLFFAWFVRTRWDASRIERTELDPDKNISDYVPESLRSFDPSDHKWIAVYREGGADVIVNATDSDWNDAKAELELHGISVRQLAVDGVGCKFANTRRPARKRPTGSRFVEWSLRGQSSHHCRPVSRNGGSASRRILSAVGHRDLRVLRSLSSRTVQAPPR